MNQFYSIQELVELQSIIQNPKYPNNRQGLEYRAKKEQWQFREEKSIGRNGTTKKYLIPFDLAVSIQNHLNLNTNENTDVVTVKPETDVTQPANQLTHWQREIAENRLFIVRFLQQQVIQGVRITRAIEQFIADATSRSLPPELQQAVLKANAKSGEERMVSRRTVFDWVSTTEVAEQKNMNVISVLAPKERAKKDIPAWAEALLQLWAKPQKPTLAACLELLPNYYSGKQPSYTQAWNFIKKLGAVEREKGRMGPRELKNIKAFIRRDSSVLLPADVYTADGHCFDAEVAHPMHGRPFKPEITAIIDVATRKMVGWSISLSESSWTVLDAIRMSAVSNGI
ncbi:MULTISPECIES: hypothetical protein [Acinetobacter]|uniref:Transposase n=1 Tax=Acinetobacter corruptisaponis TaxID=3045147 RepID=A0ABY8S5N2_9GAMM|nr:hypothetical protein [Acinetobacter sp. KCTC 92772]WHP07010.1 hypothetical protein QLH32_05985 [Acinetobacter sp. KCTC 92772]